MISIIIPIYNGETTILKTLKSLLRQDTKFDELLLIDDGSKDRSLEIAKSFFKSIKYNKIRILHHENSKGLATSYNEGFRLVAGDLVVTLHQDILLMDNSLSELVKPFQEKDSAGIVASTHVAYYPYDLWKKYNFWQKAFFSRHVGKKCYGLDGKFDCFKKSAVFKVGLFNEKDFKTAGEDGDIRYKLAKIGKIAGTEAGIIHLHRVDNNFGMKDIVYKQAQYSEAQGVLLRMGRVSYRDQFIKTFFREILFFLLFIPYINYIGLLAVIIYSFIYSYRAIISDYSNPRIFLLPLLNIWLIFVSAYYSLRGFILKKQTL